MPCSFEICTRRGEKGKTVLIAHGQRNPITVGIDYKIVCVNDFHAESGRPSLEQKVGEKRSSIVVCLTRLCGGLKRQNSHKWRIQLESLGVISISPGLQQHFNWSLQFLCVFFFLSVPFTDFRFHL